MKNKPAPPRSAPVAHATDEEVVLRATGIEKTYDSPLPFRRTVEVLDGADLDLRAGEIVGIVGECARTGVHGANRLASTSLLEGLVWGLRAGQAAATGPADGATIEPVEALDLLDRDPALPDRFARGKFERLRAVMGDQVGIERTPAGLQRARGSCAGSRARSTPPSGPGPPGRCTNSGTRA